MKPINYLVTYQRGPNGEASLPFAPFPGPAKTRWRIARGMPEGPMLYQGKPSKQAWLRMIEGVREYGITYLTVLDTQQRICTLQCWCVDGVDFLAATTSAVLLEKAFGHRRKADIIKALKEKYGIS